MSMVLIVDKGMLSTHKLLVFATAFICHCYNHAAMPVAHNSKHSSWFLQAIFHAF